MRRSRRRGFAGTPEEHAHFMVPLINRGRYYLEESRAALGYSCWAAQDWLCSAATAVAEAKTHAVYSKGGTPDSLLDLDSKVDMLRGVIHGKCGEYAGEAIRPSRRR